MVFYYLKTNLYEKEKTFTTQIYTAGFNLKVRKPYQFTIAVLGLLLYQNPIASMASLATVSIKFFADLSQFSTQMANANRQLTKTGRDLQRVGNSLSASVTLPLTLVGGAAVAAYSELEGVKTAFDRLNDTNLLDKLRTATKGTVSDLELMKAAVKAENFNIPLNQLGTLLEFARRRAKDTGESVDFLVDSIVTGIGRKSPLILDNLGISASALKDELGGAAAASSSIADITKAVGTIAGAELQKMGNDTQTFKESLQQVQATFTNVLGELGGIIAQILQPFVAKLGDMVKGFQTLSPTTKKFIVILGGIAAAIGPLLALAGTILPAIATSFALLTGPIGLIIAGLTAIGVVIYKNWAPIKQTLIDIANYFIDLYNESVVVRVGVQGIINTFKNLFEVGKFVFETLKNIIGGFIDNLVNRFKTVGKIFKAILTDEGSLSDIPKILKEATDKSSDTFKGFTKELANDWQNLTNGIKKNGEAAISAITSRKKIAFLSEDVDKPALTDCTCAVNGTPQVQSVNAGLSTEGLSQIESPLTNIVAQLPEHIALIDENLMAFEGRLVEFNERASAIVENTAERFAAGFANIIAGIGKGVNPLAALGKLILTTVGDMLQQLGKAAIQIGITMRALKLSFKSPFAAIAAGTAAIVLGSLIKSFVPKDLQGFKDGGIVGGNSFYGDKILARVNSGELILNQDQQRNLYNALNQEPAFGLLVEGQFDLKGEDLKLALGRTDTRLSRRS